LRAAFATSEAIAVSCGVINPRSDPNKIHRNLYIDHMRALYNHIVYMYYI
jgi:hypothetical protein